MEKLQSKTNTFYLSFYMVFAQFQSIATYANEVNDSQKTYVLVSMLINLNECENILE